MAAAQLGGVYLAAKLPGALAQARIAHDISIAAGHCRLNQLRELYTAFERGETAFPV